MIIAGLPYDNTRAAKRLERYLFVFVDDSTNGAMVISSLLLSK